jgi:hypothetical protein
VESLCRERGAGVLGAGDGRHGGQGLSSTMGRTHWVWAFLLQVGTSGTEGDFVHARATWGSETVVYGSLAPRILFLCSSAGS